MLFDNPVDKVSAYLRKMYDLGIAPECKMFRYGHPQKYRHVSKGWTPQTQCMFPLSWVSHQACRRKHRGSPYSLKNCPQVHIGKAFVLDAKFGMFTDALLNSAVTYAPVSRTPSIYPMVKGTNGNGPLIEALVSVARETGREIAAPVKPARRLDFPASPAP